jgi:hypothetical protein
VIKKWIILFIFIDPQDKHVELREVGNCERKEHHSVDLSTDFRPEDLVSYSREYSVVASKTRPAYCDCEEGAE